MSASERCKRVVMVGPSPHGQGGIASVLTGYEEAGLFRNGQVVFVTTRKGPSPLEMMRFALTGTSRCLREALSDRAPLFHIHMSSRGSFWRKSTVALIASVTGRPYLLHLHGSEFMTFFDRECGPLRRSFVRATFKHAALVLVLGPQWQRDVLRICPKANVEVLPNGVPVPAEGRPIANELPPQILMLGRLGRRKGTFDLLRAFSIVAKRNLSVRLVCAGDGDIEDARTLAHDFGIDSRVEFPGWLSADQVRDQLRRATIFVLPSYAEGLPMALLEAMSYGLPVITTPVGGIPAVVAHGKTGLLVDAGDVDKLASAISDLLGDPNACARLGHAARAHVEHEYSLEAVIGRIRQIYSRYGVEIYVPTGEQPVRLH